MPIDRSPFARLRQALLAGPQSAPELVQTVGLSQASLSRLIRSHGAELLVAGRARATRYALRRRIEGVDSSVPIYEISPEGETRVLGTLHPVGAEGFHIESATPDVAEKFYPDLPYFLDGMRPAGFLGRLVPKRVEALGLPNDILRWSGDHCLRYLATHGWDESGNLILGEDAYQRYLQQTLSDNEQSGVSVEAEYERQATAVLAGIPPGSSASGEQPKFLARRASNPRQCIVKFSPPLNQEVGRRVADLVVAEHLALETLRQHGASASRSRIVEGQVRRFLEVERFDRTERGRRGVIGLSALDNEYVGDGASGQWVRIVAALARQGVVDGTWLSRVAFLSAFGELIGNSDMHGGNLAFYTRGTKVIELAPAYDMLPMTYMPRQGHLYQQALEVKPPQARIWSAWGKARDAAEEFFAQLAAHPMISREFAAIALANARILSAARGLSARLPRDADKSRS